LVVRNGYHEPREVTAAVGAIEVHAPRVNDKRMDPETGERQRFSSAILPPWARKTPAVQEVLPLLYLHGLSSQDFGPALGQFLGSTKGLSAATITKLTETWKNEARAFGQRDCRRWTMCMSGPTGSTSTCAWRRPSCACWC
jgi:transposase-like protein